MQWKHKRNFGKVLNKQGLLGVGVEVGVRTARFSEEVLRTWKGKQLILVDAWRHLPDYTDSSNVSDEEFAKMYKRVKRRMKPFAPRVRILRMLSVEAAATIEDESLDFVYLDANHAYEQCSADLAAWFPKVRFGGLMCGHDYFLGVPHPETRKPVVVEGAPAFPFRVEFMPATTRAEVEAGFAVKWAVDEFLRKHERNLVFKNGAVNAVVDGVTEDKYPSWWFFK